MFPRPPIPLIDLYNMLCFMQILKINYQEIKKDFRESRWQFLINCWGEKTWVRQELINIVHHTIVGDWNNAFRSSTSNNRVDSPINQVGRQIQTFLCPTVQLISRNTVSENQRLKLCRPTKYKKLHIGPVTTKQK